MPTVRNSAARSQRQLHCRKFIRVWLGGRRLGRALRGGAGHHLLTVGLGNKKGDPVGSPSRRTVALRLVSSACPSVRGRRCGSRRP